MTLSTWHTPDSTGNGRESARGPLLFASCGSGTQLARRVIGHYERAGHEAGAPGTVPHLADIDFRFSDAETCVRLERDVSGSDVYLFQSLCDPTATRTIDQNLVALLVAIRALREWGAGHVTAVVPYLAYARQDRPTRSHREPTTAKLIADLLATAGLERLVTWHPHYEHVKGFFGAVPVDVLDPVPLLAEAFGRFRGAQDTIAVAPDLGAAKLVDAFGRGLGLRTALAAKQRPRPGEAAIYAVLGDFSGQRRAIIIDDMIASGGTVAALVEKLVQEHGVQEVHLGVSHNLCTGRALEQLQQLRARCELGGVVVTDSVPQSEAFLALSFLRVATIADVVARVVNRIHFNRPVGEPAPLPEPDPAVLSATDEASSPHRPAQDEPIVEKVRSSVRRAGRKGGPPLRSSLSVAPEELPRRTLEEATETRPK